MAAAPTRSFCVEAGWRARSALWAIPVDVSRQSSEPSNAWGGSGEGVGTGDGVGDASGVASTRRATGDGTGLAALSAREAMTSATMAIRSTAAGYRHSIDGSPWRVE